MSEKRNVTCQRYVPLSVSLYCLYTGWTNNIEKRLEAHNAGKGGKYTRVRTPVELVYLEEHESKQQAMSREIQIKRLTRREKEALLTKKKSKSYRREAESHSKK